MALPNLPPPPTGLPEPRWFNLLYESLTKVAAAAAVVLPFAEVITALGFTPENAANKGASGGYVGLTGMAINFWNSARTFMSSLTNANTAARTYILPDKDGTVAMTNDTLAAFTTGGAIAPSAINGVTVDSTTNKPLTAATGAAKAGALSQAFSTAALSSSAGMVFTNANNTTLITANTAANTGYIVAGSLVSAGAAAEWGVSGSTGVYWASGSAGAYGFNIGTSNATGFGIATNGTLRVSINSAGLTTMGNGLNVTGAMSASTTLKSGGYIVATLPTGTAGERAYVTDATTPTYLGTLTGGGSVVCPVFKNATAWVSA